MAMMDKLTDCGLAEDIDNKPWFHWRGKCYTAIKSNNIYILGCPVCGDGIPCHGLPRDEMWLPHQVSVSEQGAITATPSVVCPRNCGWHVFITGGQAVDC